VPSLSIVFFERMENKYKSELQRREEVVGTFYDSRGSQSEQVSLLEGAIDDGVDFMLTSPVRDEAVAPIVGKALQRGIPFVCVDRNVSSIEPTAYIASDNVRLGTESVELLHRFMRRAGERSKYNIVEIQGTEGTSVTNERHDGGLEAVDERNIDLLDSRLGSFSTSEAARVTRRLVSEYGSQIDGVYAHNDQMALGAKRAIADSELEDVAITGIDGSKSWIEQFGSDNYFGTIAQLPERMIEMGLTYGLRSVRGESVQDHCQIRGVEVTATNADEFLSRYLLST
jgi:ribose transport system substrate-binding protein